MFTGKRNWTYSVNRGDFVSVESTTNKFDVRLMKVDRITRKSIFIGKSQFSRKTGVMANNDLRLEPFLKRHKELKEEFHE